METQQQAPQTPDPAKPVPAPQAASAQAPQQVRHHINWAYELRHYGFALKVGIFLYIVFLAYAVLAYGTMDLYTANKAFANTAVVLLGIVLLLGPLSRFFDFVDKDVQYRKELGVVAMYAAFIHGAVTYFFLSDYFPHQWLYTSGLLILLSGLLALALLFFLFLISRTPIKLALGAQRWWFLQNWGIRICFLIIAFHLAVQKMPAWISWYRTHGSSLASGLPEIDLLLGWFMLFVIIIRLAEIPGKEYGKIAWYISAVALPGIYIFTFAWGHRLTS